MLKETQGTEVMQRIEITGDKPTHLVFIDENGNEEMAMVLHPGGFRKFIDNYITQQEKYHEQYNEQNG